MKPQPEYVLKLAERLMAAKRDLADLQAEWDGLFATGIQAAIPFKPTVVRSRPTGANNGARKRITDMFDQSPEKAFGAKDVAAQFRMKIGSARTNLSKLVKAGRIEKRGIGFYGSNLLSKSAHEKEATEVAS